MSAATQVLVCTPLVTDSHRHLAEREVDPAGLHHAGGHPPVQTAHRVAARRLAKGEDGDVEIFVLVVAVHPAHAHELLHREPELLERRAESRG